MKKFFKKLTTMFCILLLVFSCAARPKPVKADAGIMSMGGMGGLGLASLNPAVIPWILLGLVACAAVGWTIENWDDVQAVGNAVANELVKMGHSVSDFVTGTSVKMDATLKKAIKNATSSIGKTAELPKGTASYHGGLRVFTGNFNMSSGKTMVLGGQTSDLYIGTEKPSGGWMSSVRFRQGVDYLLPEVTVIVDLEPTNLDLKLSRMTSSSSRKIDTNVIKDAAGNVIQLMATISEKGKGEMASVFVDGPVGKPISITGVSVPQFGIGERAQTITTDKLKQTGIDSAIVDKYIDTAFPKKSETITFKPDAYVGSLSLPSLPTVSDKTYSDNQLRELDKIRAGSGAGTLALPGSGALAGSGGLAIPGTGSLAGGLAIPGTGALTGTGEIAIPGTGALAGTGIGWLDKILEWLKKLLDAITGIPGAILAGLSALWDWLAKILAAILAIPGAIVDVLTKIWELLKGLTKTISDAITGALTWTFGIDGEWLKGRIKGLKDLFNSKFPKIAPLNYNIGDKNSLRDLSIDILGRSYVILNGAIATKLASPMKLFFKALFYVLLAMFFVKRFYKVAED